MKFILILLMLVISNTISADIVYPGDKISIETKPRLGQVYMITWYDNSIVSYHNNKLNFDLKPVDVESIDIQVDHLTLPGVYSFNKFEVEAGKNPSDINNWKNSVILNYTVCPLVKPNTTEFSPIPRDCR